MVEGESGTRRVLDMVCPKCNLSYPEAVTRCGCGNDLRAGKVVRVDRGNHDHYESNVLICPACGLESPPRSERCDCGYDFLTGKPGIGPGPAGSMKSLKVFAIGVAGGFIGY